MRITRGTTTLSDANPVEIHFDAAAASGTAGEASRADHLHEVIDPAAPVTQAFGDAAAVGVGLDPAREDHRHGMPANIVQEFFLPALRHNLDADTYAADLENWAFVDLNATMEVWFIGHLPAVLTTLLEVVVIIIADTSETVQFDAYRQGAAAGEVYTTNSDDLINETQAVTLNQVSELDVIAAFASAGAGDYFGLEFQSDTSTLRVLGLRIRWE